MIVGDQREVIAFLSRPEAYGLARGTPVERIDTHGAVVFLVGARAYKLKRAVRFPYMDFSTCARRRRACEAEIVVNRRTAPRLYLGVESIRRAPPEGPGGLVLGGPGEAVDWVVVMQRFDQDALFDRMAARGALDDNLMIAVADTIAAFHASARPRPDKGGAEALAWVIESNMAVIAEYTPSLFDRDAVGDLEAESRDAVARLGPVLDRRRAAGRVRHCHGDLHLRNICLIDDAPTLFDAIEFNDDIACIDVLYDIAFLLMDLDHRGLRRLGNLVFNRYLSAVEEIDGLAALPLFLSCRAAVRAHVSAAAADTQTDRAAAEGLRHDARVYLQAARAYLSPPPPRLVCIGGLSGTGKSTLARAIGPNLGAAPGALVLRSDVIRKRLMGVDPLTRLDADAYRAEISAQVHARINELAAAALDAGHAVIADAVYARPDERGAAVAVAQSRDAGFAGIWLEAPQSVLEARIGAREGDESDATVEVLRRQRDYDLGEMNWHRIDTSGKIEAIAEYARTAIGTS